MDKSKISETIEYKMSEYVPEAGRIGMVVAVEMSAVKRRYGLADHVFEYPGFSVYLYDLERICGASEKKDEGADIGHDKKPGELYVIKSGAGEINAAAATQFLISNHFVDVVLNFGVAGGLAEDVKVGDVFIVDKLVHYSFDCTELGGGWTLGRHSEYPSALIETERVLYELARKVTGVSAAVCASGDRFAGKTETRRSLREQFGASVAEMEAAGVFMTADRNGVPSLFVKAVSDTVGTAADEVTSHFDDAADRALEVMHKIIEVFYEA